MSTLIQPPWNINPNTKGQNGSTSRYVDCQLVHSIACLSPRRVILEGPERETFRIYIATFIRFRWPGGAEKVTLCLVWGNETRDVTARVWSDSVLPHTPIHCPETNTHYPQVER